MRIINEASLRQQLQYQILANPKQTELWVQLAESSMSREEIEITPETNVPESDMTEAPWKHRYHPVGTKTYRLVIERQLKEFEGLLQAEQHEELLSRLDIPTAQLLAARVRPEQSYSLGQHAYDKQLYLVAEPLLQKATASPMLIGELFPWALLFLGLNHRALGEQKIATDIFKSLLGKEPSQDCIDAWTEAGLNAQVALIWININRGQIAEAEAQLNRMRRTSSSSVIVQELDLLDIVLTTIQLHTKQQDSSVNFIVDRSSSDRLMMAIDSIHMSSCGRLFDMKGWLVDPSHQLRELCLIRGNRSWRIDLGNASYSHRNDLDVPLARCDADAKTNAGLQLIHIGIRDEPSEYQVGEDLRILVVLASGEHFCINKTVEIFEICPELIKPLIEILIQAPCRVVTGDLHHRVQQLWSETVLSKLQEEAVHHSFGERLENAQLSVVVPLYGRIDFMEYQLNWFHAWRRRGGSRALGIQLIYVLDDPRLTNECLALAKRCNMLYSMPFELIVNNSNLGFAGANNRATTYAKAPYILLLNSDVLPASDDSFEVLLSTVEEDGWGQVGAVGARLMHENGSIQHQGIEFVRDHELDGELGRVWLNEHPLKGLKVPDSLSKNELNGEVPAATAACLLLRRDVLLDLGGLSSSYIVGDFEDTDLCLQLREKGLAILVNKSASFFHLERQSMHIGIHADTTKMKLVTANALTHHHRWCSTIERLYASEVGR